MTNSSDRIKYIIEHIIEYIIEQPILEHLSFRLFLPWEDPIKRANKQFFIKTGGLSVMMQLYSHFLKYDWAHLPVGGKFFESELLSSLWNLADNFPFRHAIVKEGGLEMPLASLLRVPVHGDKLLEDTTASEDTRAVFTLVLHTNIQRSIGLLLR